MPSLENMKEDDDLYRAVISYDVEQYRWETNPNNPRGPRIRSVNGPPVTETKVIGPYISKTSIKSWMTRHRGYRQNLRLVKVEKVAKWEEVTL